MAIPPASAAFQSPSSHPVKTRSAWAKKASRTAPDRELTVQQVLLPGMSPGIRDTEQSDRSGVAITQREHGLRLEGRAEQSSGAWHRRSGERGPFKPAACTAVASPRVSVWGEEGPTSARTPRGFVRHPLHGVLEVELGGTNPANPIHGGGKARAAFQQRPGPCAAGPHGRHRRAIVCMAALS